MARQRAAALAGEVGDPDVAGGALNDLGELLRELGRGDDALVRHQAATDLTGGRGDRYEHAWALAAAARCLSDPEWPSSRHAPPPYSQSWPRQQAELTGARPATASQAWPR